MTVRTRFAPSPTGYLHIGGVRTALFNWLWARQNGGQFILRIDDTDAKRNVAEALQPILDGFRWLGIDWDEGAEVGGPYGPYYQSQRLDRYQQAVRTLVERGHAYWDYATEAELRAEKESFVQQKQSWIYSRTWMAHNEGDRRRFEAEGRKGSVRLKMPREGACEFRDYIRGAMQVPWATEQDHLIQKADGTCLYNLASVVDDEDMKITHVIRAQEHLSNTPRQIFIAQGLGYELPEYAHLPFVAEPGSERKFSKREIPKYLKNADFKKAYDHGLAIAKRIGITENPESFNPVLVDFYATVGYLPGSILNYLLLLGWSLDDKTEEFSREEMITNFSLDRVNKSPASFDIKKLRYFQERDMQKVPADDKVPMCLPFLVKAKLIPDPTPDDVRQQVRAVLEAVGPRLTVAGDILDFDYFFLPDEQVPIDEKAFDQHIRKKEKAKLLLAAFKQHLTGMLGFDAASLEQEMQSFLAAQGVELKEIASAVRVAVTGRSNSPGLYDTLAVLGKARCLARIDRALLKADS